MNDNSESPDTWEVNQTINEDFDFGENEAQMHPIKIKPASKYNKKIVGLMFVVVIVFIIIIGLGYRAYKHQSLTSKNVANKTELVKMLSPIKTINPTFIPKSREETPENIKKQPDEFEATFLDNMPSAPVVLEPTPLTPKSAIVITIPEEISPPAVLNTPAAEEDKLLKDAKTSSLHKNLNALNNQIDSILNQIKYLDTYSQEVSNNLNKLKTSLSTMDNRLLALIASTATLSQEVVFVKNEMGQIRKTLKEDSLDTKPLFLPQTKPTQKEAHIMLAEPEYKVHAIIPGRAWLKTARGQIITVAEGDSIGHYGKILVIDAPNSVVLTSSGVVFR